MTDFEREVYTGMSSEGRVSLWMVKMLEIDEFNKLMTKEDINLLKRVLLDVTTKENAPLKLEELRKMEGGIVWCDSFGGWVKVSKVGILLFGSEEVKSWRYIEKTYGKTWLAYRRKPEEETH